MCHKNLHEKKNQKENVCEEVWGINVNIQVYWVAIS